MIGRLGSFVNMLGEILYVFQRPLFANSLLSIMQTLLDETRHDEMLIIGCHTLFDFINCQVWFMGRYSHISAEFDNIVSVVLENYRSLKKESENTNQNRWVQEVLKNEHNDCHQGFDKGSSLESYHPYLAHETKKEASVAIVGAIADVIRHLRKSVHLALDDADLGVDVVKWNKKFHEVVDEAL
ncbi:hypothetical protein E3N88_34117 [Mikania micrantha]|uniref:Uncharacterized protein n=1 Tax=Mikania micrantha TaxID=192012 RepID=A0A5N6MDU9_9ASTR|nr:hypothetical protein E3N88_34117 [Mikania micrantha]